MAGERAQEGRQKARDATTEMVRAIEQHGELSHLHGRPLDLGDDGPDWFLHRMLKQDGLSLPLIERSKDIDTLERETSAILERLRRRREWLLGRAAACAPAEAAGFNDQRGRTLEEYREHLVALNKAILDYNLTAPTPLHRRGIIVDRAVDEAADGVPPLSASAAAPPSAPAPASWRERVRQLLGF